MSKTKAGWGLFNCLDASGSPGPDDGQGEEGEISGEGEGAAETDVAWLDPSKKGMRELIYQLPQGGVLKLFKPIAGTGSRFLNLKCPMAKRLSPSEEALSWWVFTKKEEMEGKAVLELGAGLGLAGLLAAVETDATSIVLTDGDATVVKNLRLNIEENLERFGKCKVEARELDWTSCSPPSSQFDVIIAADVFYEESLHGSLLATLGRYVEPSSGLIVMFGSKRCGSLEKFVSKAKACFSQVEVSSSFDSDVDKKLKGMFCKPVMIKMRPTGALLRSSSHHRPSTAISRFIQQKEKALKEKLRKEAFIREAETSQHRFVTSRLAKRHKERRRQEEIEAAAKEEAMEAAAVEEPPLPFIQMRNRTAGPPDLRHLRGVSVGELTVKVGTGSRVSPVESGVADILQASLHEEPPSDPLAVSAQDLVSGTVLISVDGDSGLASAALAALKPKKLSVLVREVDSGRENLLLDNLSPWKDQVELFIGSEGMKEVLKSRFKVIWVVLGEYCLDADNFLFMNFGKGLLALASLLKKNGKFVVASPPGDHKIYQKWFKEVTVVHGDVKFEILMLRKPKIIAHEKLNFPKKLEVKKERGGKEEEGRGKAASVPPPVEAQREKKSSNLFPPPSLMARGLAQLASGGERSLGSNQIVVPRKKDGSFSRRATSLTKDSAHSLPIPPSPLLPQRVNRSIGSKAEKRWGVGEGVRTVDMELAFNGGQRASSVGGGFPRSGFGLGGARRRSIQQQSKLFRVPSAAPESQLFKNTLLARKIDLNAQALNGL